MGLLKDKLQILRPGGRDTTQAPLIYACSHDHLIKGYSSSNGRLDATFSGHERAVYAVLIKSSTSSFPVLISAGYDTSIRIWDLKLKSCIMLLRGHADSVFCLLNLPDGRLASGSSDKTIKVWNLKSKKCEATLVGHLGGVLSLVYLPTLNAIASSSTDNNIKIWSLATGKCEVTLTGHTAPVSSLALLTDELLVSGSHDETIRVWNISLPSASPSAAHANDGVRKAENKCERCIKAHAGMFHNITDYITFLRMCMACVDLIRAVFSIFVCSFYL